MIEPLALDVAHLFAGGLVLVSVMLLYQVGGVWRGTTRERPCHRCEWSFPRPGWHARPVRPSVRQHAGAG